MEEYMGKNIKLGKIENLKYTSIII